MWYSQNIRIECVRSGKLIHRILFYSIRTPTDKSSKHSSNLRVGVTCALPRSISPTSVHISSRSPASRCFISVMCCPIWFVYLVFISLGGLTGAEVIPSPQRIYLFMESQMISHITSCTLPLRVLGYIGVDKNRDDLYKFERFGLGNHIHCCRWLAYIKFTFQVVSKVCIQCLVVLLGRTMNRWRSKFLDSAQWAKIRPISRSIKRKIFKDLVLTKSSS